MSENKIPEREVGSTPIAQSFKGILRVSNIKEPTTTADVFLNPDYYGEYIPTINNLTWEPEGIQSVEDALSGKNKRYFYGNDYTVLKLPVTDSMGNYLNFSLGTSSSLIGNDLNDGMWSLDTTPFYSVSADSIKIGLSGIDLENKKSISGGKLYIENKGDVAARLIVNSFYQHGLDSKGNPNIIESKYNDLKTIYQGTADNNLYDSFFYNQESYISDKKQTESADGFINNPPTKKHCIVKLANLGEYITDKISSYIKFNTTEIPTGNIVQQYCSIDKWYCRTNNGDINDSDTWGDNKSWQGYRPALGNSTPSTKAKEVASAYAYDNTEQGVFSNDLRIKYNIPNYSGSYVELPPEFKRGYVLADGSSYDIRLIPPYMADIGSVTNSKKSIDTFFNLFFTIGYYYTQNVPAFPHLYAEPDDAPVSEDNTLKSKPTYGRYYFDYNMPKLQDYSYKKIIIDGINKETLYGISIISLLAFQKFSEAYNDRYIFQEIKGADGKWDIEKSIEWLSKQNIEEKYIFNTVFSKESIEYAKNNNIAGIDNIIYNYSDVDNKHSLKIAVGKEINKFSDYIEYYKLTPDSGNNVILQKVPCQIYKMAEIYDIARLFANKTTDWWENYTITFNVPAAYSDTDNDVNEFNSISGNTVVNGVGLFIGSNALSAFKKVILPNRNDVEESETIYSDIDSSYTYQQSNCVFNIGQIPHSHALAKGVLNFTIGRYNPSPVTPAELNGLSVNFDNSANTLLNISEVDQNIISADTTWKASTLIEKLATSNVPPSSQNWADKPEAWNYFLQERGEDEKVKLHNIYGYSSHIIGGKELAVFNDDDTLNHNMKWYGRTGEPLWDPQPIERANNKKYTLGNSRGYFRPQSIRILPLIKL